MTSIPVKPVLIVGGSGIVGARVARILRQLHPDLPLAIGARNLEKARALADELGSASAVALDLSRPDLGLPPSQSFSAFVMIVKDDSLTALQLAQAQAAAYVNLSSYAFEIAPEVAYFIQKPDRAPVLLDGLWLAGVAALPALALARQLEKVESIAIGALLDERDIGGPAADADNDRIQAATQRALILERGAWRWVGAEAMRRFRSAGSELNGRAYSVLDTQSLAATTGASSVRFDLALGESAGRRAGGQVSSEITLELEGWRRDGTRVHWRQEIDHPEGQAPLTATGIAVAVERLLGLAGGERVPAGLYLPHVLIAPELMLERMQRFGARVQPVEEVQS